MRTRITGLAAAFLLTCSLVVAAPPEARDRGEDRIGAIMAQAENLRREVLELALSAYDAADSKGYVVRPRLTIIDYLLPSYEKRLWVIDMESGRLLYEEWVAHGMGSPAGSGGDMEKAISFSNRRGTRKSSLGLFRTAETYYGKHGYSLRLDGLEPGINDAARERTIVVHPAHYVTRDRAEQRLVGRSWGCPAVRPKIAHQLIDDIKGGSLIWTYYPDVRWFERSAFLRTVRSSLSTIAAKLTRTASSNSAGG
jgi:hypothetical protein